MRDYEFGEYIYNLRKQKGLSQAELGALVGVSNKAVSKWETGEAKPAIMQLKNLSKIFNISINDLLDCSAKKNKEVTKIVITGGPCAGKSTALSWIREEFTKKGYAVVFVPESATELILAGITRSRLQSDLEFQLAILKNQLEKEKLFEQAARKFVNEDKILIVCDRGTIDNKAYMSGFDFKQLIKMMGLSEIEMRDSYDAVFHLVTAAKGAEEFYTKANNNARSESLDEARHADSRALNAWTGHPHLRVIDNSTNFEDKIKRLIFEISSFLGEPVSHEIERKYLIEYPNLDVLEQHNVKKVEIIQTYLYSANGEEIRIRQRGDNNNFIYTKTTKHAITGIKRVEVEKRITKDEYLSLLLEANTHLNQIRKTRYCLVYKNQYIEIDTYPFSTEKAIMEIELSTEDSEVNLPDFVKVIKEVTNDDKYKNYNLAKTLSLDF